MVAGTPPRTRLLALAALGLLSACQDYQFTPVGRCLMQPGRASVAIPAAVDLLFVVDDSLSMDPYQESLANSLGGFIERLAQAQRQRVASGRDPLDFHVAVTSTSVRVNRYIASNGACGRLSANTCSIDEVTTPPARRPYSYACTSGPCGDVVTNYYNYTGDRSCLPGVLAANGDPYPAGAFVAAAGNPRVLSFTKDLDWANASTDARIQDLIARFRRNVLVGSCGANQEMPFEAARLAISSAMGGRQGLPAGVTWPHPNSRLVVVFVGNEDDCSTPRADEGGLVWDLGQAGADSCAADAQRETPLHLTPAGEYLRFLTGLKRPLGVAFVRPGFADCGGAGGSGPRMKALAASLAAAGVDTVEASVCGDFSSALERIAGQLAVPDHLDLPSTPAAGSVTRLLLRGEDGQTAHVCEGPGDAASTKEWWFVDCAAMPPTALPAGRTAACVQVRSGGGCEPRPGQTLVAEYLGRVPAQGCAGAGDCARELGGAVAEWQCVIPSGEQRGSCSCAAAP